MVRVGQEQNIAQGVLTPVALPTNEPTLVLVGCDDAALLDEFDSLAAGVSSAIDVRSNVAWREVPDGRRFLDLVLNTARHHEASAAGGNVSLSDVRFGFAQPEASIDELVERALFAPDLLELARLVEASELIDHPPTFQIRYQPIVTLSNHAVLGFESLIRATANGHTLAAEELIRRATESNWLPELDSLGRTLALRGIGPWLGQGLLFLNMMAPDGSFDLDAIASTADAAKSAGIDADQIVLEATERNRYTSLDLVADQIAEIRSMGLRIAVDDVGDGYSSLSVIAAFRPDVVKLSGTLTRSLPSTEAESVIRAVVQMSHAMGSWVVAENIETMAQADQVRALGVDWGQGHFFGSPLERTPGTVEPSDN